MRYFGWRNLLGKSVNDVAVTVKLMQQMNSDWVQGTRVSLSRGAIFGGRGIILKCLLFGSLRWHMTPLGHLL